MAKHLVFVFLFIVFISCGRETDNLDSNINFDKNIKKKVEEKIAVSEIFGDFADSLTIYDNTVILDYFENDSLVTYAQKDKKIPFVSVFYSEKNILTIDGLYGVFAGFGFSIKIKENKGTVFYLLESRDSPQYSLSKNDSLQYRLEVPCLKANITLTKIPELKEGEIIYGMVELESDNYYQKNSIKKFRANMKIYFKSMFFDKK